MKKLLLALVAIGGLSFVFLSYGSDYLDPRNTESEARLVGTWKFYEEHSEGGNHLVMKAKTVIKTDGTEETNISAHFRSSEHNVSASTKIQTTAEWKVIEDEFITMPKTVRYHGFEGDATMRDFFKQMEMDSRKRIDVETIFTILDIADDEFALETDEGEVLNFKRTSTQN